MTADRTVVYDRPVPAELHVHLANGETFKAEAKDVVRFGYVVTADVNARYHKVLDAALRAADGPVQPHLAPLIDLMDWALYGQLEPDEDLIVKLAALELRLIEQARRVQDEASAAVDRAGLGGS